MQPAICGQLKKIAFGRDVTKKTCFGGFQPAKLPNHKPPKQAGTGALPIAN
jgi:hypothetical protein